MESIEVESAEGSILKSPLAEETPPSKPRLYESEAKPEPFSRLAIESK